MTNRQLRQAKRLLRLAQKRMADDGILTAGHYIGDFVARSGSSFLSQSKAYSGVDWDDVLKKGCSQLVFTNRKQKLSGLAKRDDNSWEAFGTSKWQRVKDAKVGNAKKTCMVFECIVTTDKEDRDNDILEPKGALIDRELPLLWQHIPVMPIGKLLEILQQDEKRIRAAFGILDNAFGRDCADMVEYGMLRISHGFRPTDYRPRSEDEGDGQMGFRISGYEMVEVSLVSVPSNSDAVITMAERKRFRSEVTKSWAKNLRDELPDMVVSGWAKSLGANITPDTGKANMKRKKKKTAGVARLKALTLLKSMRLEKSIKLSKGRLKLFDEAKELLDEAVKDSGMKASTRTLVKGAIGCISEGVKGCHGKEEDEEEDEEEKDDMEDDEEDDKDDTDEDEDEDKDDEEDEDEDDKDDEEEDDEDESDDGEEKDDEGDESGDEEDEVDEDEGGEGGKSGKPAKKTGKKTGKKKTAPISVKTLTVAQLKDVDPDVIMAAAAGLLAGGQNPNLSVPLVESVKTAAEQYSKDRESAVLT